MSDGERVVRHRVADLVDEQEPLYRPLAGFELWLEPDVVYIRAIECVSIGEIPPSLEESVHELFLRGTAEAHLTHAEGHEAVRDTSRLVGDATMSVSLRQNPPGPPSRDCSV